MLDKIKYILSLNPKSGKKEEKLNIQVGTSGDKIVINFDRKVNQISFDRAELTNLLSVLASRASLLK